MTHNSFRTERDFIPEVRLHFGKELFVPRAAEEGGAEKYGCTLIVRKGSDAYVKLGQLVTQAVVGGFGEAGKGLFKSDMVKNPLLPGDGKQARIKDGEKAGEIRDGYGPDVVFIRVSRSAAVGNPQVVDERVLPLTLADFENKKIKNGDYVNAVLTAFSWENSKQGKGIGIGIEMLQKLRSGEELAAGGGAAPAPTDFFKPLDTSGGEGAAPASSTTADSIFG